MAEQVTEKKEKKEKAAKIDFSSLKKEDEKVLMTKSNDLRVALRKLRFDLKLGQLDDSSKLKKIKKEIAQVETQLSFIKKMDKS